MCWASTCHFEGDFRNMGHYRKYIWNHEISEIIKWKDFQFHFFSKANNKWSFEFWLVHSWEFNCGSSFFSLAPPNWLVNKLKRRIPISISFRNGIACTSKRKNKNNNKHPLSGNFHKLLTPHPATLFTSANTQVISFLSTVISLQFSCGFFVFILVHNNLSWQTESN